eukprot:scaffold10222_cov135-Isochrysis_galbana.AAC.1
MYIVQADLQARVRARNRTCVELSSSPTTRARLAPMSKVGSVSVGWVPGRRGAIVTLHARAEFFAYLPTYLSEGCAQEPWGNTYYYYGSSALAPLVACAQLVNWQPELELATCARLSASAP